MNTLALLLASIVLTTCASSADRQGDVPTWGGGFGPIRAVELGAPTSAPLASTEPSAISSVVTTSPSAAVVPAAPPADDDPCLVGDIELRRLPQSCDCETWIPAPGTPGAPAPGSPPPKKCPPPHAGPDAPVAGLEVSLNLASTEVQSGTRLEATVKYVNTTETPIALRFHRNELGTLALRDEAGARIPIEGPNNCAIGGTLGMAQLRGIWLRPGATISAQLSIDPRRKRRVNGGRGEFDCDTVPGSALPAGKYQVILEYNALFRRASPAPAPFTVTAR